VADSRGEGRPLFTKCIVEQIKMLRNNALFWHNIFKRIFWGEAGAQPPPQTPSPTLPPPYSKPLDPPLTVNRLEAHCHAVCLCLLWLVPQNLLEAFILVRPSICQSAQQSLVKLCISTTNDQADIVLTLRTNTSISNKLLTRTWMTYTQMQTATLRCKLWPNRCR